MTPPTDGAATRPRPELATSDHVLTIRPISGWFDLRLDEVWKQRELLWFLAWKDIKVRYKETVIGAAWAILQPVFSMLVFTVFFGRLAKVPSTGLAYPVFFFTALVPWTYFAGALQASTNTMVENQKLVTKVYFPRLILPFSSVLSGILDLAIAMLVMIPLLFYYHVTPTIGLLFIPLLVLFSTVTAAAFGLWLSGLNALYRDVRYVIPFFIQAFLFASPVIYSSTSVPPKWQRLYALNPMTGVIEGFRWALTGHGAAPGIVMLPSVLAVLVILVGGLIFFVRVEGTLGDIL